MALKKKKRRSVIDFRKFREDDELENVVQEHQSEMYDILYGDEVKANSSRRSANNLEWLNGFQSRQAAEQARREKIANNRIEENSETRKECELDRYKVDLSDLLDPSLCQGENFIPNIMKKLGLNGKLINNPVVVHDFEIYIGKIMRQNNMNEWKGVNGKYTREQIEKVAKSIEKSDLRYRKPKEGEIGIKINQENGSIDKQVFRRGKLYGERYCIEDEEKMTVRISDLSGGFYAIYDGNGVEIRNVRIRESSKNESIRLLQYPFATKDTLDYEGKTYESYSILDLKDLSNFYGENVTRVDSLDDVETYYEEHKEEIEKAFDRIPEEGRFNARFGNSLKIGLKKMAQKAGILTKQK